MNKQRSDCMVPDRAGVVDVPSGLLVFTGVLAWESTSEAPQGLFPGCCRSYSGSVVVQEGVAASGHWNSPPTLGGDCQDAF